MLYMSQFQGDPAPLYVSPSLHQLAMSGSLAVSPVPTQYSSHSGIVENVVAPHIPTLLAQSDDYRVAWSKDPEVQPERSRVIRL